MNVDTELGNMANGPSQDDFDFGIIGTDDEPFIGYISAQDPTNVSPRALVKGSVNVIRSDNGTVRVRPGLKTYGEVDATVDGVVSSFEWTNNMGITLPIRVLESGVLQFQYGDTWYTLGTYTETDFSFSTWWDNTDKKDILVMVNGEETIKSWSGGIDESVGSINSAGVMVTGSNTITSLSAVDLTGTDRVDVGNNSQTGNTARSAFVLDQNPSVGDTIQLIVAQTAPFPSGTVSVVFSDDVSGAQNASIGLVKIGATKEDTAANLIAFFQSPGTDTATQRGISDATIVDAVNDQTYTSVSSLSTGNDQTWQELGFTGNSDSHQGGSIVINGVSYSYSLIAERYLVNTGAIPSPEGQFGFQELYTDSGPTDGFICDFVLTITNQILIGSLTSKVIYLSADTDYLDFVNGGSLVYGDPDFAVLDEFPIGGIVAKNSAYISAGPSNWYVITPNTPLPISTTIGSTTSFVITSVEKQIGAGKTGLLGKNFISSFNENIIYLSQDNQLRTRGIFRNIVTIKSPSVSINVRAELLAEDFTGGALRVIDEITYITAPISGNTYLYQVRDDFDREGNVLGERLWQPPQTWNISRLAIIDGLTLGYSASNPMLYELWDTNQYHDDTPDGPMPYLKKARFGYWHFGDRTKMGNLDKVYVEGYTQPNDGITLTLRSDYLGSTAVETNILSAIDDSPTLYSSEGVLIGDNLIGAIEIGGGTTDTGPTKFRVISDFVKKDCFEYQLEMDSEGLDDYWELLAIGTNGRQVINKPVFLRKG